MIEILKERFENNMHRHKDITWKEVAEKLDSNPEALKKLSFMEETEGEPDVIGYDGDRLIFADCSKVTPKGRRSLCYDDEALKARKKFPPEGSAVGQANKFGIRLMTEEEYRYLQTLEDFDMKCSSWIDTPKEIRDQGGALFCEKSYGNVYVYHNGASSYYAARGWRGILKV